MNTEFSRRFDVRQVEGKAVQLIANENERAAMTRRFGLVSIGRVRADILLERDGRAVKAKGTLSADIVQSCAVSGDDLSVAINEELSFRFVPQAEDHQPDEEIELGADDCDEIEYSGTFFDLGEAVAQSLALAIDPFATGPGAAQARRRAGIVGEEASGPFAALAALKKKD
jgi:uncharacterized metal-binding protein YceD (DUF177 family)